MYIHAYMRIYIYIYTCVKGCTAADPTRPGHPDATQMLPTRKKQTNKKQPYNKQQPQYYNTKKRLRQTGIVIVIVLIITCMYL